MRRVEKFLGNEIYADLAGAISSGLCTGTLVWMIASMSDSKPSLRMWAQSIIFAVASYTASTVLLQKFWTGQLRRMIPSWMLTAALGTALLIGVIIVPKAIAAWGSPQRVEATLSEFISVRLEDARSVFIVFGFVALLIMAIFHYAGLLIKAVRKWHYGEEEPLSILGKNQASRVSNQTKLTL